MAADFDKALPPQHQILLVAGPRRSLFETTGLE
jgi:hypothetical protein